tara:strand:- start:176 stop:448 length:273 start_codon:yes stop_codon:yes gene_type:complete
MRYIIFILLFGLLVTLFFIVKNEYVQNKNATVKIINQKSSLIKCELKNEIIDMKKLDSERQCYYECGKDDIVRVDTSISYPCQNYIMENR